MLKEAFELRRNGTAGAREWIRPRCGIVCPAV